MVTLLCVEARRKKALFSFLEIKHRFFIFLATSQDRNEGEDDSERAQSTTDNFFRLDGIENVDKIIEELIKACRETKKRDQGLLQDAAKMEEDFPALNDVAPPTSALHWPNVSYTRSFSARLKDGRIELGFHVRDSERLIRLTGGNMLSKKSEKQRSGCDVGELNLHFA